MKLKKNLMRGTLLAAAGVAALVPFNMGGCLSVVGDVVGGPTGGMIKGSDRMFSAQNLDENAEDSLGQAAAVVFTNQFGVSENQKHQRYVNLIGLTLANSSSRPGGNWVFAVLSSEDPEAFSGPNGYVMVSEGVLKLTSNEAELAGVIAHEICHVTLKHGLNAVKKKETVAGAVQIGASAAGSEYQMAFNATADSLVEVVGMKFSQGDEFAADLAAVKLLIDTGYDPRAYAMFLEKLSSLDQAHGGLGSHPSSPERVSRVNQRIAELGYKGGGAVLEARFKQYVNQ